jgi:hypothetical protein
MMALRGLVNPATEAIFHGMKGVMRTPSGRTFTYDELRHFAIREGIFEGLIRGELNSRRGRRRSEGRIAELVGRFSDTARRGIDINDAWVTHSIETMETRWRMETFLHLIESGATIEDAARRTKKALYDWSSPISEIELDLFLGRVPFYRVKRNLAKHGIEILGEGLLEPDGYLQRAAVGQTKLARARQQWYASRAWNHMLTDKDPDQPGIQRGDDLFLPLPQWVNNATPAVTKRLASSKRAEITERRQRPTDMFTLVLKPLSPLEGIAFPVDFLMAMGAIALYADARLTNDTINSAFGVTYPSDLPRKLAELSAENMLGLVGPVVLETFTKASESAESDIQEITPAQAEAYRSLPFVGDTLVQKVDGKWQMNKLVRMFLRLMPVVNQYPTVVQNAFAAHDDSDSIAADAARFLSLSYSPLSVYYGEQQTELKRMATEAKRAARASDRAVR